MPSSQITRYFDSTERRKIRDDLVFSVSKVGVPKTAIDCGCGAGADINYLLENGFNVHAFDIEPEAIARCRFRFSGIEGLTLTQSSFTEFDYPRVSLVVADASLFFCLRADFSRVWQKICECLYPNGVFCGSFLGVEDTMAIPGYNPSVFWRDVTAFDESEVKALFKGFDMLRFNVHKSSGKTAQGVEHNWHIFQVVAQKLAK